MCVCAHVFMHGQHQTESHCWVHRATKTHRKKTNLNDVYSRCHLPLPACRSFCTICTSLSNINLMSCCGASVYFYGVDVVDRLPLTSSSPCLEKSIKQLKRSLFFDRTKLVITSEDKNIGFFHVREEARTHEMVENLQQRMNDNNAQLQTLTTSTRFALSHP